jgi:hypothetical protein
MGYWESLDEERIEQQSRLPWYERDYVLACGFLVAVVLFFFEVRYVLKAAVRQMLSYL